MTGNLGGLGGADALCQTLAGNASPSPLPGTYKAWLSDDSASPSTRFRCTAASCSARGYTLVDGTTVVATDWADLTDGALNHAIDHDESGALFSGPPSAWADTTPAGTLFQSSRDCAQWADGTNGSSGLNGGCNQTGTSWTQGLSFECNSPAHLYCFQQD